MNTAPKTYGDVAGLITMLQVACEDADINQALEQLLSQPDDRRKSFLRDLLPTLRERKVSADLIAAMACLTDDQGAERAYREIYDCSRKLR